MSRTLRVVAEKRARRSGRRSFCAEFVFKNALVTEDRGGADESLFLQRQHSLRGRAIALRASAPIETDHAVVVKAFENNFLLNKAQ